VHVLEQKVVKPTRIIKITNKPT